MTYAELQAIVQDRPPRVALILGSGLSDVADRLTNTVELPFSALPGMSASSVAGHRGVLLLGTWAGVPLLVFAGRLHYYEGHPWRHVLQPIHIAHELGARVLVATNAAGGIRDDLQPGDLMALHGHVDCTRPHWWREEFMASRERKRPEDAAGPTPVAYAPGSPYSSRLLDLLPLPTGVYAQLTGPSYETPCEIRALRTCGVDAVGMSTAREIEAAFKLGMECAAISCITNKAAGLGDGAIQHDDVTATGRKVKDRLASLLETFVQQASA